MCIIFPPPESYFYTTHSHFFNNYCLHLLYYRDIPLQVQALIKAMRENKVGISHNLKNKEYFYYVDLMVSSSLTLMLTPTLAMQDVNFENDWKLVTIFVGVNDLCDYCNDQVSVL